MNRNWTENGEGTRHEAEETLRLVAALPPPGELTDRIHARLGAELRVPARRGFWAHWQPARRFQFAGAAALAVAVAGSTWTVYHRRPQAGVGAQTVRPVAPVEPTGEGFGTAGAVRVPPTLNPIKVHPAPHRKPGVGHAAVKPKAAVTAPATAGAADPN